MRVTLVVIVLLVTGCGGGPSPTPLEADHAISGTLALTRSAVAGSPASECHGMGGYADVATGSTVVLKDAGGTIVGTARLSPGTLSATGCTFAFTMAGVADSPFYTVTIGTRAGPTFQRADLAATNWALSLTLGEP